jgi:selenocysteine-specific elongation factor
MRSVVVGTAGHIDHGKSALVLALTGTDPDRLKEEKARGITIELGFAHWQTTDINFAFVDVPGHERFVKNMLAGAGGVDVVLLVIAADESVMPQTREHFEICRLLQVRAGIIVLTKVDLVDDEVVDLVRLETRELVAGSFLDGAPILAVSSRTGQGLADLREALRRLGTDVRGRSPSGATRLPIDRVFSMKGFGTVVTGTLVSGRIEQDEELVLLPSGRTVKVRGVQVHGEKQAAASAGQRVAVNLGGVEVSDVARGETLVARGTFEPTSLVDTAVEVVRGVRPLKHGARVRFHQGTSEVLGRVAVAGEELPEIAPGGRAYVRLRLEAPAVVTRGDRFILRAYSPPQTIGGGLVLDPRPPLRAGIRRSSGVKRFARLDPALQPAHDAGDLAVALMIAEAGTKGFPARALTSRAGVAPGETASMMARLAGLGHAALAGDLLLAPSALSAARNEVLAVLKAYHEAEPLVEGIPREELRERLFSTAGPGVFERVLDDLVSGGQIAARERVALTTHRVELSGGDEAAREVIERAFADAGLRPPEVRALGPMLGLPPDAVDRVVKLLLRQKVLGRIDTLVFHEQALRRLKADVAALKPGPEGQAVRIDVATFKDRYGVTRKYAIPLLEYLDRERVTKRAGDARVIL